MPGVTAWGSGSRAIMSKRAVAKIDTKLFLVE